MAAAVEAAAEAVLTLTESLEPAEFLRSRLTRQEVTRQLRLIMTALGGASTDTRAAIPELDYDAWALTATRLDAADPATCNDALWFAITALTPTTLSWLRLYRSRQPELFGARVEG